MSLVQKLDAVLPQTQCGLCGYAGCRPYAEAMAVGVANINHCPPGGLETLHALAMVLDVDPVPYEQEVTFQSTLPAVAKIIEEDCIGCTKCIQACPVDAIVGAAKLMHTILEYECTGCGLCVAPCPVDCIEMVELPERRYNPDLARSRFEARQIRKVAEDHAKVVQYRTKRRLTAENNDGQVEKSAKKTYIIEALARVKAKF